MLNIFKNKINLIIGLTLLWQLISVGLVSTGVWSSEVIWLNFGLLVVLIAVLPRLHAIGAFLVSLPFMVVIPENILPNLPMWRPLVAWLFVIVALKYLWQQRQTGDKLLVYCRRVISDFYRNKLNPWDKWLAALVVLAALSLLAATFPSHGLKQILFLINIYLLYLSTLLAINQNDDWRALIKYFQISLLITVGLGFVQYFATFTAEPYYFWQYWATLVSSVYYGQPLAEVLSYSNSWFSAEASGANSLRMFGILQDTHAFGVIVLFALAMWWARARATALTTRVRHILRDQSRWYWLGLVLLCFAVIASGTRGMWVAMAFPLAATVCLIYRYKARLLGALPLLSYTLIILLFLISPWITMSFNWLRTFAVEDNFLRRAASIYDLREASNMGRLEIWQDSIQYSLHNPLGTGYGNFITSIVDVPAGATFEEAASDKNLLYNLPQKFITAHSLYLHLLVELGVLGVLLFLAFWVSVGRQLWKAVLESEFAYTTLNLFFMAVGIVLLWLLAYGLFDVTILNERVLLYLMVLLALLNMALRNRPQTLF